MEEGERGDVGYVSLHELCHVPTQSLALQESGEDWAGHGDPGGVLALGWVRPVLTEDPVLDHSVDVVPCRGEGGSLLDEAGYRVPGLETEG